ncbi:hypothetical protein L3Y34_011443 [Caenorhabditis briggsae]|uniref:Uncharacterized protein n=1 Tax=Caenorhabditis briggsae TaxID=6238 RepID=A0AAE8ZLN8_CAEBR|nr:hypothetical protein L3Y34_011443 [Caenorhabditis briggsae]
MILVDSEFGELMNILMDDKQKSVFYGFSELYLCSASRPPTYYPFQHFAKEKAYNEQTLTEADDPTLNFILCILIQIICAATINAAFFVSCFHSHSPRLRNAENPNVLVNALMNNFYLSETGG